MHSYHFKSVYQINCWSYANFNKFLGDNRLFLPINGHTPHIDGLVQERCNSTVNALELHVSCINLSISWQVMILTDIHFLFTFRVADFNCLHLINAKESWKMRKHVFSYTKNCYNFSLYLWCDVVWRSTKCRGGLARKHPLFTHPEVSNLAVTFSVKQDIV